VQDNCAAQWLATICANTGDKDSDDEAAASLSPLFQVVINSTGMPGPEETGKNRKREVHNRLPYRSVCNPRPTPVQINKHEEGRVRWRLMLFNPWVLPPAPLEHLQFKCIHYVL
jgi:hypothetical protein